MPSLVEVFDSILSGKAVDRSCLESLQQSILRGEIAAQVGAMGSGGGELVGDLSHCTVVGQPTAAWASWSAAVHKRVTITPLEEHVHGAV